MLPVFAAMPTSHELCHKEIGFTYDLEKPVWGKVRAHSDDLSTAAPSPASSPLFGPEKDSPFLGPDELLLPDLSDFQLPDAQQDSGSDAEFELSGFDHEGSSGGEFGLTSFEYYDKESDKDSSTALDSASNKRSIDEDELTDLDEDIESELLDLLGGLASLRAEQRQQRREESDSSVPKIPYPQLESGFLPTQFMPMQSWLMPAGRAATGKWACAMAPRPSNDSMEPLNIIIGQAGVTLEVASGCPDELWSECEQKLASMAKAVFRRRKGRSRSPSICLEEMQERKGARGRARQR
jgi:hypothetical protein